MRAGLLRALYTERHAVRFERRANVWDGRSMGSGRSVRAPPDVHDQRYRHRVLHVHGLRVHAGWDGLPRQCDARYVRYRREPLPLRQRDDALRVA